MNELSAQVGLNISIAEARRFALDQIGARISADPGMAAAFWNELDGAALPQSGIAVLYCFLRVEGARFALLEFVAGQTIEQLWTHADPAACERATPLLCRMLDACDLFALENHPPEDGDAIAPAASTAGSAQGLQFDVFGIAQAAGVTPCPLYGTVLVCPDGSWSEEILSDESGRSSAYPMLTAVYKELVGVLPAGAALKPEQLTAFSQCALSVPEPPGLFERSLPYFAASGAGALLILSLFGLGQMLARGFESQEVAGLQLPAAPVKAISPRIEVAALETEAPPRADPALAVTARQIQTRAVDQGPTRPPSLVYQIDPEYPAEAREQGLAGIVTLEITIADTGFVRTAKVLSGSHLLARSAVQAVKKWVYEPAMVNGKPVSVTTSLEFQFHPDRLQSQNGQ